MAEEVTKEKIKRTKKNVSQETSDDSNLAPLIDADTLKTGFGLFFLFLSVFYYKVK